MGQISSRKVLDPTLLWCILIGRFTERGVSLPDWIHGNISFHSHLLSGNVGNVMYTSLGLTSLPFVSLPDLSINLLVSYHECCFLIGYATHYLFYRVLK